MGLNEILKGFYITQLTCDNCKLKTEIKVQRGKRIEEWIEEGKAKCKNCGCFIKTNQYASFERVRDARNDEEFEELMQKFRDQSIKQQLDLEKLKGGVDE